MPIETSTWNIVIIGGWNRAILTPQGVAQRLFKVEAGTPVDVEVALDSINTLRVNHDSIKVIAKSGSLELIADDATFDCMDRAKKIASNALESLPATPVAGAGINFRFVDTEPPGDLLTKVECPLDTAVADQQFEISNRRYARSLVFNGGILNIDLSVLSTGECEILLNFHKESHSTSVLKEWVDQSIEPLKQAVDKIIKSAFAIESYNGQ
tara:strand:+ start:217 stop:849 length:633 start_codon:yes stop_codon:yes gene_type:complete